MINVNHIYVVQDYVVTILQLALMRFADPSTASFRFFSFF